MKKIGIMGGTFNPIHNAHLMMAQAAYEQYNLDEVWFMPSKNPPHKDNADIVSEEHRSRMVQLAIEGKKEFVFSDLELRRQGITYTYETLKQCVDEYPDVKFYFILGGDSLLNFDSWYHPEEICKLCSILAISREGMTERDLKNQCQQLSIQFDGEFYPVEMPQISISSAQIRMRLEQGKSVVGYLPEKVWRYLEIHSLYGVTFENKKRKEKEILAYLGATLRPQRYMHTLGVAYTCANLAMCHMENSHDEKKARLAGLLHDCAKYLTDNEMLKWCDLYKIELTDVEKSNPALVHGKLGAYLAQHRYGVKDDEICFAIACHTTGKPNMTTLEKILYVADYIEPRRKMECQPYSLSEIRKKCFSDLDEGLFMILTNTITYLNKESKIVDDITLQTYEFYKKRRFG